MELYCHTRAAFSLPRLPLYPIPRSHPSFSSSKTLSFHSKPGLHWSRATASEETSTIVSQKFGDALEPKKAPVTEDFSLVETPNDGELSEAEYLLSKLGSKLELDDTYYILFYGAGALLALWISSAVVSAIDTLPLFPKVLELVGLGYTIWFSYRYLIFKKNREELFSKIEKLKEEI
ncbi:protein CURVATURE THYLAKOID 1D, chloroplastic-like [Phalaenopsis equestris]|uniref:protein CURVATURE THYLAKOID 1D, chloroplastic-like n=1 Tax=Phalaenopsis equestris TaxID=78828 RepID=UPI0009E31443|nr:protein CURVATURE THYLAKOID 1D, chloroplastic-like [Phalaenopsis equestris]